MSAFQEWLGTPQNDAQPVSQTTDPRLPILVVGAGPAGLAGMAALQRAGIEFVGIDAHREVGGIWDETNPTSSIYEGMCTVTSRFTTHLGKPVPDDCPNYIPHRHAHAYLVGFSHDERLRTRLWLATRFEDAAKTARGTWRVRLKPTGGGAAYEEEFRAIIFATGAHNRAVSAMPARLRTQAAEAGLRVLHSSEYRRPEDFAGKRVLIVGIGNSGSDIADKLSHAAARTVLAVRTSPWINPQTVMGVPCDKLAADSPDWLPEWYRLGSFHLIRWLQVGGFRRLGLTMPTHSLNDRLPIGDRGIVAAIRAGRVTVRSHVTDLAGGVATFADSQHTCESFDAVLFATGFERRYPLLTASRRETQDVADLLSFKIFHRSEPGLAYLAETVGFRGCWPVFVEQARALAAYYQAEALGTPNVYRFNARRGVPTPDMKGRFFRAADKFHVDYDRYEQSLRDLSEWLRE